MIPPIDKNTFIKYQFGIGKTKIYRWHIYFTINFIVNRKIHQIVVWKISNCRFLFSLGKTKTYSWYANCRFWFSHEKTKIFNWHTNCRNLNYVCFHDWKWEDSEDICTLEWCLVIPKIDPWVETITVLTRTIWDNCKLLTNTSIIFHESDWHL